LSVIDKFIKVTDEESAHSARGDFKETEGYVCRLYQWRCTPGCKTTLDAQGELMENSNIVLIFSDHGFSLYEVKFFMTMIG